MAQTIRFETLSKDNYDTWKMFMDERSLLVKNDLWQYVINAKPEVVEGNQASAAAAREWDRNDAKARLEIILAISLGELKQIKGCTTARAVWSKLQDTYESKGPARKAALLKQLTMHKMQNGSDVREHINKFFDILDKINEIGVEINANLLAIMLLSSLSSEFENFRCAIESRDELPPPEILRVKIIEDGDARRNIACGSTSSALYAGKRWKKPPQKKNVAMEPGKISEFKYKCYKCHAPGHKSSECKNKKQQSARTADEIKTVEDISMFLFEAHSIGDKGSGSWYLDSGATSHFCRESQSFNDDLRVRQEKLSLVNTESTRIVGEGTAFLNTSVNGEVKRISFGVTQLVPDLRANLLSVSKITDRGFNVLFDKDRTVVIKAAGDIKLIANKTKGLYIVQESQTSPDIISQNSSFVAKQADSRSDEIHRKFGHQNSKDLQAAIHQGRVHGIELEGPIRTDDCIACLQGKMTRNPFPMKSNRTSNSMDLIHTDVCRPMRVISQGE